MPSPADSRKSDAPQSMPAPPHLPVPAERYVDTSWQMPEDYPLAQKYVLVVSVDQYHLAFFPKPHRAPQAQQEVDRLSRKLELATKPYPDVGTDPVMPSSTARHRVVFQELYDNDPAGCSTTNTFAFADEQQQLHIDPAIFGCLPRGSREIQIVFWRRHFYGQTFGGSIWTHRKGCPLDHRGRTLRQSLGECCVPNRIGSRFRCEI